MAVGVTQFLNRFEEFARVSHAKIQAVLDEAEEQVDRTVFGSKADTAVLYLAAHLLSISPHGKQARLVPPNAKATREDALTTYERQYRHLVRMVAGGYRVTGSGQATE